MTNKQTNEIHQLTVAFENNIPLPIKVLCPIYDKDISTLTRYCRDGVFTGVFKTKSGQWMFSPKDFGFVAQEATTTKRVRSKYDFSKYSKPLRKAS